MLFFYRFRLFNFIPFVFKFVLTSIIFVIEILINVFFFIQLKNTIVANLLNKIQENQVCFYIFKQNLMILLLQVNF
jgi:hypothetical protein